MIFAAEAAGLGLDKLKSRRKLLANLLLFVSVQASILKAERADPVQDILPQ